MSTLNNLTAEDESLHALILILTQNCPWLRKLPTLQAESGRSGAVVANSVGIITDVEIFEFSSEGETIEDAVSKLGKKMNERAKPAFLVLPPLGESVMQVEDVAGWIVAKLHIGMGY